MPVTTTVGQLHCRAVFLSDIHFGHRACRADHLQGFLDSVSCESLYLLGDIVDCEALRRTEYWPLAHQRALRTIFDRSESGTRVVYVPGNHDADYRALCGHSIGAVEVHRSYRHRLLGGQQLLLLHGDEFDARIDNTRWLRWIGHNGAEWLIHLNRLINGVPGLSGRRFVQASNLFKQRVARILRHIECFHGLALESAGQCGCDGVVAGHIHFPTLAAQDRGLCANCGDWVESCTGLVETHHGDLQLWHWSGNPRLLASWSPDDQARRIAA